MIQNFKSSVISRLLVCIFVFTFFYSLNVTAFSAVTFSGSGTEKDPYLITNAEQFNAIRNNLSAHYRLANTIDLSAFSNFVPIGNLERPFTGSLTCEIGADKLPKYAIKNLSVHVKETPYIAENKSRWEAAAFGCAQGAEFTNIFMLNVKVANDNFGDNTGSVVYGNYKPGMGEQFSAALVGLAMDCTITGCMSSGAVDTSSNNCGGLIGRAEDSSVNFCYSVADVKSKGLWGVGGLIGTLENTSLSSCFYAGGEVSCGSEYSSQGMLFATANSCVISDCYASGKGLGVQGNLGWFSNSTVTNCYTSAQIDHSIPEEYIGSIVGNVIKNTYILDTVSVISINDFLPKASAQQLKTSFSGLSAWNTSGQYPTLSGITILTDEQRYVPGAVNTTPGTVTSKPSNSENSNVDHTESSENNTDPSAGSDDLKKLQQLADALPDPSALTEDNIDDVLEAKNILNQLSDTLYAQLDTTVSSKIEACYTALQPIMLTYLVEEVNKLDLDKITASDKEAILRLNRIFEGLSDTSKEAFSYVLSDKLQKAVEKVESMEESSDTVATQAMTTAEKIIVLLLSLVVCVLLAVHVVLIVLVVRKKRILGQLCLQLQEKTKDIYSESVDAGERL